jgi:hypothetical protein
MLRSRTQVALVVVPLLLGLSGCKGKDKDEGSSGAAKSYEPRLTSEMLPADLKDLLIGTAAEEAVKARFPGIKANANARHNDRPAISFAFGGMDGGGPVGRFIKGEALLVKDGDGPAWLHTLAVTAEAGKGDSLCDFVDKAVGALKGVDNCKGTFFRHEKTPKAAVYCLGTPDGKRGVVVQCSRDERDGKKVERLRYSESTRRRQN